tara:strand:+ start:4263 stop:4529 length:267 start_codon:yes stop_codon:yes gene_type:complete
MERTKPSQTERLYTDIDTLVEKLGNIIMRTQDIHRLHGAPIDQRNDVIRYLQAELRYAKLGSDIRKEEEKIRTLRDMIGLDMRKYRGE